MAFGCKILYNIEADFKIEKALKDQGLASSEALKACIASGESSCQPNTLPSPSSSLGII